MRGIPHVFGTEQDVINAMKDDPAATKAKLQELLDGRFAWFNNGPIEGKGIKDATHKIEEYREDENNPDSPVTLMQYELREDPNAKLFQIGLNVAKAEAYLKQ